MDNLKVALFKNDGTAGIGHIPKTTNPSGVLFIPLLIDFPKGFIKGRYKFAGPTKNGFLKYNEVNK